jgi:hypothetical protein
LIPWHGQHIDDLNGARRSPVCVSQAERTDAIIQTTGIFSDRFVVTGYSYRLLGTAVRINFELAPDTDMGWLGKGMAHALEVAWPDVPLESEMME